MESIMKSVDSTTEFKNPIAVIGFFAVVSLIESKLERMD